MFEQSLSFQGKSKWLLLIPTEFERGFVSDLISPSHSVNMEVCGFGPIVPAARAISLIEKHHPDRVILIGIAGSYDEELQIGAAYSFGSVASYGVGVGTGESFQTAGQMGWYQWLDPNSEMSIGDKLPLTLCHRGADPLSKPSKAELLTVCAAASGPADVRLRKAKFPSAVAEDMEGFAVAAACKLTGCPVSIVRGISNRAGDRDKQNWKMSDAMASAIELVTEAIGKES